MNNREIVSKIENTLRGLNKDGRIPPRFILKVLRDTAKVLIAQKLLERTLTTEETLYTEITCLEFEKVNVIDCPLIEFRLANTLMKSKRPIPQPIYSRLGSAIRDITSIDGLYDLDIVPIQQYRRNNRRKYEIKNRTYVYIDQDNYLYIVDKEIYAINLREITQETEKVIGCNGEKCTNYWEAKFIVPDRLIDAVTKDATQLLLTTYKQIIPDQNPNTIEGA